MKYSNVFLFYCIQIVLPVFSNEITLHECNRDCSNSNASLTCYYKFEYQSYYTMSKACYNCPKNLSDCYRPDCVPADGVGRMITTINRKIPGPDIQVCLGDTIVVDVMNEMMQEATTVHWHGLEQYGTPYMDGVPFITQCPIHPNNMFRYEFKAENAGTHFWHSHTGCQRADGAYGSLIVRKNISQVYHSSTYDYDLPEHVMLITDWIHEPATVKMAAHFHSTGNNKPDTILINGRGRYQAYQLEDNSTTYTPVTVFRIKKNFRYRFRLINAGFLNCPIEVSFDRHTMMVINSDGGDLKPINIQTLVSYAGERWDFIINGNREVDNYWIRFRGLMDCDERFNKAYNVAILRYEGAEDRDPDGIPTYDNSKRSGMQLNSLNKGSGHIDYITAAEVKNLFAYNDDPTLKEKADMYLTLSFDFYPLDNPMFQRHNLYGFYQVAKNQRIYTPQINHISLKIPSAPLLSQSESIDKSSLCNDEETLKNCTESFCSCTYIINVPLNAVVEITLIDLGVTYDANHPFHLHGHSFRVLALDKLGDNTTVEEVKTLDSENKIKRNLKNPPKKDTVTIPDGGYTIIRYYANNPGYWLLHCHIDFHVEIGMAVIFKVGESTNIPPVPDNFPRCGNINHGTDDEITKNKSGEKNFFSRLWDKSRNTINSSERNNSSKIKSIFVLIITIFVSKLF